MEQSAPDFVALSRIEEQLLVAKLDAARKSITHSGEKGRALEHYVLSLLRTFLPAEYGLSTGFIVWASPQGRVLSKQLDIIIYDAIRYGPLIKLETCDVFPLEAVYGYVEVKAAIRSAPHADPPRSDSIEASIRANSYLRQMNTRHFVVPEGGSPISMREHTIPWLSLRSYVFAFELDGSIATFAQHLADGLRRAGDAHLHGVFVAGEGFLHTRAVDAKVSEDDDFHHVRLTRDDALLTFKASLLGALATFQRAPEGWTPNLRMYFEYLSTWEEFSPQI